MSQRSHPATTEQSEPSQRNPPAKTLRVWCGLTTQAQRPGARDATIANRDAMPGSLQRMVSPRRRHLSINPL